MAKRKKRRGSPDSWDPVVVYSLDEGQAGYDKGYRFRVHDFDDDGPPAFFVTKDRMVHILTAHCMMPVTPERMTKLRLDQERRIEA